ncbi:MAG: hypothetical protein Q8S73_06365 [Deltaproteobacteria bacterium]|nr:hypothetical protein [Myxococcales bacterium]MDP3213708.1 hypothetical protein [Deltaproteobacteria bacterium]
MVRRAAVAVGALLTLGSGCSDRVTQNATALLVVVEADPAVRMRGSRVAVTVRRGRVGTLGAIISTAEFRADPSAWPFTFVVQAQDPSPGVGVEVSAEVFTGGDPMPISFARAASLYTNNQAVVVPLMFWGGCTATRCGAGQTCLRPTGDGPVTAEDCGAAAMQPTSIYSSATQVGACGMMQYRYGAMCRNFPMPPGDGGTADVPDVPDVPLAPADSGVDASADTGIDAPVVDAPIDVVVSEASMDAGTDAGTDAGLLPDVPLCIDAAIPCIGGGFATPDDPANCGFCGNVCTPRPNTAAGCAGCQCTYGCTFGWSDCDSNPLNGCETNTLSDPAHCGNCLTRCDALPDGGPPTCVDQSCVR